MCHFDANGGEGPRRPIRCVYPMALEQGKSNSFWASFIPHETRVACQKDYKAICSAVTSTLPTDKPRDWVDYFRQVNRRCQGWSRLDPTAISVFAPIPKHLLDHHRFRQFDGSFTCMIKSFSQAMDVKGGDYSALASEIYSLGIRIRPDTNMSRNINNLINRVCNRHGLCFVKCSKSSPPQHRFIVGVESPNPMLVKLWGVPHCVSVYGSLIFEPSEATPLPSTLASLDFVCGGPGLYRGVEWTKVLVPTVEAARTPKHRRHKSRTKKPVRLMPSNVYKVNSC